MAKGTLKDRFIFGAVLLNVISVVEPASCVKTIVAVPMVANALQFGKAKIKKTPIAKQNNRAILGTPYFP